MFHPRVGKFTTNFPLATFLYPFFLSSILLGLEKNCTVFAFMFHSVTNMYCSGNSCIDMCNSRFTPGHQSNTPRAYLWSLIDSLVNTAASFLFGCLLLQLVCGLVWFFFKIFFLFKVRSLVISSCIFYRGNLLRGIFIYLVFFCLIGCCYIFLHKTQWLVKHWISEVNNQCTKNQRISFLLILNVIK